MSDHLPLAWLTKSPKTRRVVILALLLMTAVGCGRVKDVVRDWLAISRTLADRRATALRVATSWPLAERRRLSELFEQWQSVRPGGADPSRALEVVWIPVNDERELGRIDGELRQVDVYLGGSLTEYVRLAQTGKTEPIEAGGGALWYVSRHSKVENLWDAESSKSTTDRADGRYPFKDPRDDPRTLALAIGRLKVGEWGKAYRQIVREVGQRRADSNSAGPGIEWTEGAAIRSSSSRIKHAREFLRFLVERGGADRGENQEEIDPALAELIADLLGAALIDAREELEAAWVVLEKGDYPANALRWMTEPPPWPPASVGKILDRGGDNAMLLLETLAGQLTDEPGLKLWLVQSWLGPKRLIDMSFLAGLTWAQKGNLMREPRFRAWLRAEWTAWARQRYRRVARLASEQDPSRSTVEKDPFAPAPAPEQAQRPGTP